MDRRPNGATELQAKDPLTAAASVLDRLERDLERELKKAQEAVRPLRERIRRVHAARKALGVGEWPYTETRPRKKHVWTDEMRQAASDRMKATHAARFGGDDSGSAPPPDSLAVAPAAQTALPTHNV